MVKIMLPPIPKMSNNSPWLAWNLPKGESGQVTSGRKKEEIGQPSHGLVLLDIGLIECFSALWIDIWICQL